MRGQTWLRFCFTLTEFNEALIYPRHVSRGPGVDEISVELIEICCVVNLPKVRVRGTRQDRDLFNP